AWVHSGRWAPVRQTKPRRRERAAMKGKGAPLCALECCSQQDARSRPIPTYLPPSAPRPHPTIRHEDRSSSPPPVEPAHQGGSACRRGELAQGLSPRLARPANRKALHTRLGSSWSISGSPSGTFWSEAPPDDKAWDQSVKQTLADLKAMCALVSDPKR